MHESCREAFQLVRDMANELADELDCTIKVKRSGRAMATYFELIPDGSAYGPEIRVNDAMMKDTGFMDRLLQDKPAKIRAEVKGILERLEEMKKDPDFEN